MFIYDGDIVTQKSKPADGTAIDEATCPKRTRRGVVLYFLNGLARNQENPTLPEPRRMGRSVEANRRLRTDTGIQC
jgi:hypothetical protein